MPALPKVVMTPHEGSNISPPDTGFQRLTPLRQHHRNNSLEPAHSFRARSQADRKYDRLLNYLIDKPKPNRRGGVFHSKAASVDETGRACRSKMYCSTLAEKRTSINLLDQQESVIAQSIKVVDRIQRMNHTSDLQYRQTHLPRFGY